jgi:hypothetical protein
MTGPWDERRIEWNCCYCIGKMRRSATICWFISACSRSTGRENVTPGSSGSRLTNRKSRSSTGRTGGERRTRFPLFCALMFLKANADTLASAVSTEVWARPWSVSHRFSPFPSGYVPGHFNEASSNALLPYFHFALSALLSLAMLHAHRVTTSASASSTSSPRTAPPKHSPSQNSHSPVSSPPFPPRSSPVLRNESRCCCRCKVRVVPRSSIRDRLMLSGSCTSRAG